MSWLNAVNGDARAWLLEPDSVNPGVRLFAFRDLLDQPADAAEVIAAQAAVMQYGPVPAILEAQHPDGYWQKPGGGYGKYRGTAWQIIFLGELGADPNDERVQRGCAYLLNHTIAANGGFACSNTNNPVPRNVVHCLNGNLLASLIRLGWLDDPRVQQALVWQIHAITGEEPIRYDQSGTSGPGFACAINAGQPCAWGATKAMKALAAVPTSARTPLLQQAIEQGAQFLLRHNLAGADYPFTGKISPSWFKLGFPLSYWSDILETLTVLVTLGYGHDPRLAEAYQWLLDKQDAQGRWKLENALTGKMWIDLERRGKPSKWVTLRALRVVKAMAVAEAEGSS
ncbi:hypothetical protein EYB53_000370 [Candidatus Chloroploca sp. M-50]|uniref:Nitrogen fixation protein NifH n=1 Tax=Candidatus Chloroploca mongolica TaxID=2528176 RepID=A0ABS4D3Y9_9CHLR|nr:nitrogen fixation protein NifH [Candidatus Chloroploca mongolica]MBP1464149.1 hypothetical protein [Candidatus Chloroploca mongolica]